MIKIVEVLILNRVGITVDEEKTPYEVFCVKLQDPIIFELLTQNILFLPSRRSTRSGIWKTENLANFSDYLDDVDGYCVWFKSTRKIQQKREVVFSSESISTSIIIVIRLNINESLTPDCNENKFDADEASKKVQ